MTTDLPTLRLGSRGPAVVYLTVKLDRRGYSHDSRNHGNRFTKTIEKEVKRFQAQHLDAGGHPLDVDGVVGPKTWGALLRPENDDQRISLGVVLANSPDRIPIVTQSAIMRPLAHRLLAVALADYDAGRHEDPMGSNRCPWLEKRAQGKPWCSFQVHAWIHSVLGRWIFGGRRGSTRMDLKCAMAEAIDVDSPQPGDVFLLCDADGVPYHTGLVLRLGGDQMPDTIDAMQTIEGNCANRVAMREREITDRFVFWRPFPGELEWEPGLLPNVKRVAAKKAGTR